MEEFYQYIWQFKLYKPGPHVTCQGQQLEIINPGEFNSNSGPDFFNAKIKLDGMLWAGNVEIHARASDWQRHGHNLDDGYNNVILHVILENDHDATTSKGQAIASWVMPIDANCLREYEQMVGNRSWVACAGKLGVMSRFELDNWLERLMIEKIEQKTINIGRYLSGCQNDWEAAYYLFLARNFGFGLNNDALEQLARQTPWKVILKYSHDITRLEALLLGQAGFLHDVVMGDEYMRALAQEYKFIARVHDLKPVERGTWKFLRSRPSNFPTIRLVQLAWLLHGKKNSFSRVIAASDPVELLEGFNISPSGYWLTHYRPGHVSPETSKSLGVHSRQLLLINAVVPLLFAFGLSRGEEKLCQKALSWLEEMPPEKNMIIEKWKHHGVHARNASRTQALVYLKQHYCNQGRCLQCRIGHRVLTTSGGTSKH